MLQITLNEKDANAILGMADITLKSTGLQGVDDVMRVVALIKEAAAAAQAAATPAAPQ